MTGDTNAWDDLMEALTMLAKHKTSDIAPFNCEHDTLWVASDAEAFTPEELEKLDELGFSPSEEFGGFLSYRFGSA